MRKLSLAQLGLICIGSAILSSSMLGARHGARTTFTTGDKAELIGEAVVIGIAWLAGLGLLITHFVKKLRRPARPRFVDSKTAGPKTEKPEPTFDFLHRDAEKGE